MEHVEEENENLDKRTNEEAENKLNETKEGTLEAIENNEQLFDVHHILTDDTEYDIEVKRCKPRGNRLKRNKKEKRI